MDPLPKRCRRYHRLAVAIGLSGLALLIGGGLLLARRESAAAPATLAQATGEMRLERLASVGDNPSVGAVAVAGDRLYAGFGARFVVAALADGAAPVVRGSVDLGDDITAIATAQPHVYVMTTAQLLVVDVADPIHPRVLGSVPVSLSGNSGDIDLAGHYAYLGVDRGLEVVDVADPIHPRAVVTTDYRFSVSGVAVVGAFAFLAGGGDQALIVMDVQNPAAPIEVARLMVGDLAQPGLPAPGGNLFDVQVDSGYAYVTMASNSPAGALLVADVTTPGTPRWLGWQQVPGGNFVSRLRVAKHVGYMTTASGVLRLDLAHPASPVVRAWWSSEGLGSNALDVLGSTIYVASVDGLRVVTDGDPSAGLRLAGSVPSGIRGGTLAATGRLLYVTAPLSGTLSVFDSSDADAPKLLGMLGGQIGVGAVAAEGGMAYRAANDGSLAVIDATDPARLHVVGSMTATFLSDLAVQGGLVYAAAPDIGLVVVDARTPTVPREIGRLAAAGDGPRWVEVAGSLAYVLTESGYLTVIDVSDPGHPRVAGGLGDLGDPALGLALAGQAAVILDRLGNLTVVDVTDPSAPRTVGRLRLPREIGLLNGLTGAGRRVLIACVGPGALAVVDVTEPTAPRFVNAVPLAEDGEGVEVAGNLAYVDGLDMSNGGGRVRLVDIAAPGGFEVAPGFVLPGGGEDVRLQGHYAFVTAGTQGLHVVDVADPARPALLASIDIGNQAGRLAMDGNTAYIASPPPRYSFEDAEEARLTSVDVADPSRPRLLGTVPLGVVDVRDIEVDGGRAVLLLGPVYPEPPSLQVWDVTTAASPRRLGEVALDTESSASGLALAGDMAYVVGDSADLVAVNISDPARPTIVGQVSLGTSAADVAVGGHFGYVVGKLDNGSIGSLAVVDLADPQRLHVVGSLELPVSPRLARLDLTGSRVFVTNPDAGAFVVDVADPAAPRLLADYWSQDARAGSIPPPIRAVAAAGDHAYLATDDSVLWSLAVTGGRSSASVYLPLLGRQ